jgi:hypothetical protein
MEFETLKRKKLELEARLSQSIFEILDEVGEVPERLSVDVIKNTTIAGETAVAGVQVEVKFGL